MNAVTDYQLVRYPDGTEDFLNPQEAEFLSIFSGLGMEDQRRVLRIGRALVDGQSCPPLAEIKTWNRQDFRTFADSLPEVAHV